MDFYVWMIKEPIETALLATTITIQIAIGYLSSDHYTLPACNDYSYFVAQLAFFGYYLAVIQYLGADYSYATSMCYLPERIKATLPTFFTWSDSYAETWTSNGFRNLTFRIIIFDNRQKYFRSLSPLVTLFELKIYLQVQLP